MNHAVAQEKPDLQISKIEHLCYILTGILIINSLEANGMNQIFGYRNEEAVIHERKLAKELGGIKYPDRIVGLRQTTRVDGLLYDSAVDRFQSALRLNSKEKKKVFEVLEPCPFERPLKQGSEHLLYPFFVLEAKSGKAADDWNSIRRQTSFPIKAFLDAQDSLLRATKTHSDSKSWPLVWFISNRGDLWHVSAAYMQDGLKRRGTVGNIDYVRH